MKPWLDVNKRTHTHTLSYVYLICAMLMFLCFIFFAVISVCLLFFFKEQV